MIAKTEAVRVTFVPTLAVGLSALLLGLPGGSAAASPASPTAPAPASPAAPAPATPNLPPPGGPGSPGAPAPVESHPLGVPGGDITPMMGTVVGVKFNGLKHLNAEIITPRLQTRVGAPVSGAVVEQDAQAILDTGLFYKVLPRLEQGPNGTTVVFDLVENPYITSIEIEGNSVVATPLIVSQMLTKPNQVLNIGILNSDFRRIERLYSDKGYVFARVIRRIIDPDRGVLRIVISEGIVEDIRLVGNKKTSSYVVLKHIKTKPGTVFNEKQWQEDLKSIFRLNIFSDIRYDRAPGSELGKVVLIVTVVEQKTGTVNFGFGYNTRERGVVFLNLADTNFRGRAESVDAQLELGGYRTRGSYRFSFYEPWLGNTDYSAGANLYKQQTDRIVPGSNGNGTTGRYFESRTGGGVTFGRRLSQTRQILMDLKNEAIGSDQIYGNVISTTGGSITTSSSLLSPFLLQKGSITSVTLRHVLDTRDLPLNPRSGAFSELLVEPGRGTFSNAGDSSQHPFNFLKLSADLRKYIPVGALVHKEGIDVQKVLATRLLYGRSSPGIPAFQYFFLGGADTLRGYQDDSFFGENVLLWSTELRVPVALNKLQWVTFADLGDAWGGNYTPVHGFRLYSGIGMGVRVVIPSIGPLRLDYAYGKFGGRTHFSIGQTF